MAAALSLMGFAACRTPDATTREATPRDARATALDSAASAAAEARDADAPVASDASSTEATAAFPPLEAASWLVPMAVDGFDDAMVAVPLGSREPRPLVVALHGNFDRAEWACSSWRAVAGPEPFILCPRGKPRSDAPKGEPRWTYAGSVAAERELRAGVAALRALYGARVASGPAVYTGFSLGAIVGTSIVSNAPREYSRFVFVEGGHDGWAKGAARRFAAGGGERALFVCAQPGCVGDAKAAAKAVEAAGVRTKVVYAGNVGHAYDGPVADTTRTEWGWVSATSADAAP